MHVIDMLYFTLQKFMFHLAWHCCNRLNCHPATKYHFCLQTDITENNDYFPEKCTPTKLT